MYSFLGVNNFNFISSPNPANRNDLVKLSHVPGFPSISKHENKGNKKLAKRGGFSTTSNYENYLNEILNYHASESPANHFKRHEIIKGDALDILKDLPDNCFSLITAFHIIEHISFDSIQNILVECNRVLKKEGVVIVAEPILNPKSFLSIILCKLDRGHFIRTTNEYKILFTNFVIKTANHFKFGGHYFCSFVLKKNN